MIFIIGKERKYKNGSVYIVVIIVFMFVTTVSLAMLSMVVGNYKARVSESKRIENLYGSESGLDIAYNIIGKNFDAAAQYGKFKVNKLESLNEESSDDETSPYNKYYIAVKKDMKYWKSYNSNHDDNEKLSQKEIYKKLDKDKEYLDLIINQEFKRAFNNFLNNNNYDNKEENEKIPNKLKDSLENSYYINRVNNLENTDSSYDLAYVQFQNKDEPPKILINDDGIKYNAKEIEEKKLILESSNTTEMPVYNGETYTIKIKSSFETEGDTSKVIGKNLRTVERNFVLSVPNCDDIYFSKYSQELMEYPALKNKSITIGKNMFINNLNKIDVTGDVYVNGDKDSINGDFGIVYNKYKGGITISNVNSGEFINNIVTKGTFNIGDNVGSENNTIKLNGDIYAGNFYLGNINGSKSTDAYLESKNLILDNDLTLNSSNTHMKIENFYGINDRTIRDSNNGNEDKNSSSIIVNGNEKSEVKITDNAYIMGVAYIDTKDENGNSKPYKTGESLAYKGNYIAYAVPDLSKSDETFSYYNPLYLLDYDNKGNEVEQKKEHFEDYWDGKLENKNAGGIVLPKTTKAIGAIIYRDSTGNLQVKNDTEKNIISENDMNNIITPKRLEFAKNVYNLGYPNKTNDEMSDSEKKYFQNLYDLKSSVSPQYTIDTIMNIPENIDEDNDFNYSIKEEAKSNKDEKAIFTNKDVLILGDDSKKDYDEDQFIVLNGKNKEIAGVIGTNGNVIVDGDVNFKGTIIAKGNLIVTGKNIGNGTSIKYDNDVIERLNGENQELFSEIFGNTPYINEQENDESNSNTILNPNYDLDKFIKTTIWKLIK